MSAGELDVKVGGFSSPPLFGVHENSKHTNAMQTK